MTSAYAVAYADPGGRITRTLALWWLMGDSYITPAWLVASLARAYARD